MPDTVLFQVHRGVARLTLNRPEKKNALRREIIAALIERVRQAADDERIRVLVLESRGDVFCAGMDLSQMQERAESDSAAREYQLDSEVYCELLISLFELPIPVIAEVQGPALAGGMGLVCACDLVVASETAFFMLPEPMRGIIAAMVTPLLVHRVGPGPAGYFLLSGGKISAADAHRMGLVHEVAPTGELEERIERLVHSILAGARSAYALTKQHLRNCAGSGVAEWVRKSVQVSAQARESADAREGLAAFLEKRKPAWQIESGGNH